jgi:hypothetical protein
MPVNPWAGYYQGTTALHDAARTKMWDDHFKKTSALREKGAGPVGAKVPERSHPAGPDQPAP